MGKNVQERSINAIYSIEIKAKCLLVFL